MPKSGIFMPDMGMEKISPQFLSSRSMAGAGLADALFTRTQQRVLGFLFGQPGRSFYATELIGLTGAGSGAVQRELARLTQSGLVTVRPIGSQKHYQANPESPLYAELCAIVRKTVGLAQPLRAALEPLAGGIDAAFVFGSVASSTDTAGSDIDLMLISDTLEYADVYQTLEAAGSLLSRPVNPTILARKDLARRLKSDEAFTKRVLARPRIWLIGDEDALGAR